VQTVAAARDRAHLITVSFYRRSTFQQLAACATVRLTVIKMISSSVNSQAIHEELRRIEGEVVQGERQLAEKEKLLVTVRRQKGEESEALEELEMMRAEQREREQRRQQLLAMLRP